MKTDGNTLDRFFTQVTQVVWELKILLTYVNRNRFRENLLTFLQNQLDILEFWVQGVKPAGLKWD